jgi:isocitrate dehydrogenase
MFEAIHGSAPRRAGQNLANPSGLFLGSVLMLVHIDQPDVAARVHNAWLKTVEDGVHTYDIFREGVSKQKVGTKEFAQAVVSRIGQTPEKLKPVSYVSAPKQTSTERASVASTAKKELQGVDLFIYWPSADTNALAAKLNGLAADGLKLTMLDNRGTKVWPGGAADIFCCDQYRARYLTTGGPITHGQLVDLLGKAAAAGVDFVKTEHLQTYDGERGYTLAQGE